MAQVLRQMQKRKWLLPLAAVLATSALLKATLMCLGTIDFTSDEGVVALMARHITQGKWPVFYYGEAYVGSLGATITAGAFLLFGESVTTARVVQIAFYLGTIVFTYLLAQRLFGHKAAVVTALLMALPPVMVTLYTTVGIGAYGETLLFGAFLLWLGHRLAYEWADRWIWWLIWGSVAGLGFWSLGLIVLYIAPVAVLWLFHFDRRRWPGYLLAVCGFLVCSSPWWIYDFTHDHAAFRVLYDPADSSRGTMPFSLLERLGALLLLGLPALTGLRFPWSADYILVYLAPLVLTFYVISLLGARRRWASLPPTGRSGFLLLVMLVTGFIIFFLATRFGIDATGRYLLPLYPPLCIAAGGWWSGLSPQSRRWGSIAVALMLAFNLTGVALATAEPVGLTTQLNASLQTGNAYDDDLIAFLVSNETPVGYSHHWVSFKIAFLSHERVILAPLLPFRINPYDDPDRADRYPPYTIWADAAPNPVYVTSNQPWLDETLRQRFAEQGITFEETTIGPYHVFHHLSQPISAKELGPLFVQGP